ncbi:hypothetical protein GQ42DRAFT_152222 [Ramicandelaber brevisporus]|nr:hypothetical protein GQ42DRAFT_152222 [Ramicandelaber brevisporus]
MLDSKTVLPPPGFTPSSNESFIAQLAAQLCSVAAVLQHEMQKRTLDKLHELTAANETLTTSVAKLQGALSQARAYTKELERELLEIKASRPKMPQSHSDLKRTVGSSLNLDAKAFIPRKQLSPSN